MKRTRLVVVVLMSVAVLAGLLTPVARAAPASTPVPAGSRWPVAATLALGGDDVATSCPTTRVCTAAAGGELVTTGDGGLTWNRATAALPADVAAVVDLDCPTAAVCVVLARLRDGGTAVLTGSGAGPLTRTAAPDTGTATAVACATPSRCTVTDGRTAWFTRDRGATWRPSLLPRIAYDDAGLTWTRTAADARLPDLDAVSCGSTETCAVTAFVYDDRGRGGPVAYGTGDGGATWRSHRLETGRVAGSDVACAGTRCYVPQENRVGVPVVMTGRP